VDFRQKILGIPSPLVVFIAVVLIYAWKFGRPSLYILQAKKAVKENPALASTPVPLAEKSASEAPGTAFSEYGFRFEVPWVAKEKSHQDYAAIIYVPDGDKALVFFNPAQNAGLVEGLRQTLKDRGKNPLAASLYLNAMSDYELERSIWYTTPDQLSLFFPRRKDVFGAMRLSMKDVLKDQAKTGVYAFTFGNLRGFQFGDPSQAHGVRIDAFDDQDRHFVFSIGTKSESDVYLKQAEINRVLQSLRPTSASQASN
jgi:hypothetical protein